MKVVCNSTTLIGFSKIDRLNLLRKLFSEILIPESVYNEVVIKGKGKPGSEAIATAEWVKRKKIHDEIAVSMLSRYIDRGEAEVLVLGKEMKADLIIIDEDKARDAARAAGFKVIGLVGLLITAKKTGLISKVRPILDELKAKDFYVADKVYNEGLKKAGELT